MKEGERQEKQDVAGRSSKERVQNEIKTISKWVNYKNGALLSLFKQKESEEQKNARSFSRYFSSLRQNSLTSHSTCITFSIEEGGEWKKKKLSKEHGFGTKTVQGETMIKEGRQKQRRICSEEDALSCPFLSFCYSWKIVHHILLEWTERKKEERLRKDGGKEAREARVQTQQNPKGIFFYFLRFPWDWIEGSTDNSTRVAISQSFPATSISSVRSVPRTLSCLSVSLMSKEGWGKIKFPKTFLILPVLTSCFWSLLICFFFLSSFNPLFLSPSLSFSFSVMFLLVISVLHQSCISLQREWDQREKNSSSPASGPSNLFFMSLSLPLLHENLGPFYRFSLDFSLCRILSSSHTSVGGGGKERTGHKKREGGKNRWQ